MKFILRPLTACLCLLSVPDIVPDNTKTIAVETRLELGAIAERCRVAYRIEKGDTLASIAKARLGEANRWEEIVAQNRGIEPTKLRVGGTLWLPPRNPATTDPMHVFVAALPMNWISPWHCNAPLPSARYAQYTVYLVPASRLAAFETCIAQEDPNGSLRAMPGMEQVQQLTAHTAGRYVASGSPIAKTAVTLKIVTNDEGRLAVESEFAHFDAAGERLAVDEKGRVTEGATDAKKQLLLLLLALGGGFWLLCRARQPRSAAAMA